MSTAMEQLKERLHTVIDLNAASGLLSWDQHTYMPKGGLDARIRQLTTLESLSHEYFSANATGELLARAEDEASKLDPDSDEARLVRVIRREYDQAVKLPAALVEEKARITGRAMDAWMACKPANDFAGFRPHLEAIFSLCRREAEALGYPEQPYDALLGRFEPGMLTSRLKAVFDEVKQELIPLCKSIFESKTQVEDACLYGDFDPQAQWDLGISVLEAMGYSFDNGRQDQSPHPFTTEFGLGDVRVTTRIHRDDFKAGLFGTMHEGGHALYEQNVSQAYDRSFLAGGTSLGIHESQSRLWENLVGRSPHFCQWLFPRVRKLFPAQFGQMDEDDFYRAINRVKPSLIRIEADEVTYSLHIFLRFELELELLSGELQVADLPEAWNAKMESYLGIKPPTDKQGCLQDMHWSDATVGYFPTYALGNLYGVQIWNKAQAELGSLNQQLAQGELTPLREWLSAQVYTHGRKYDAPELVQRITGEPLKAKYFIEYLRNKYTPIFGL